MKYKMINQHHPEYSISRLCDVFEVSRSGYYDWVERCPSHREQEDDRIGQRIQAIFEDHYRCYGVPRMQSALEDEGIGISRKRIARLMKQRGCCVKTKKAWKPCTTQANSDHPIRSNILNREFQADRPHQKWMSDITYIRTQLGFLYLAAVIDLYSRKIVGFALADHMESTLVEQAFKMAWHQESPTQLDLHHSDRGAQYTSHDYQTLLKDKAMTVSMSRKGNCWDSAPIESFWGSLKSECAYQPFESHQQARSEIFAYIMGFYNNTRKHSALGYLSPVQFEQQFSRDFYCPN